MVGQKVPRQNFEADPAKAITTLPLAVLTNRGTADAAEVAAAALMDNKRAQVVGERTYGDAALRRDITMEDGGAIILSVAKYYSPEGKAIQDTGVTPNNVVSDADAQIDVDDNGEPLPEAPGRTRASRRKWKTTRWSRRRWNCSPRDNGRPGSPGQARRPVLQRLQVGDQIVLLPIAEHVLVGRHPLPALVDPGPDVCVRQLLPVGHLVLLEKALQPGPIFFSSLSGLWHTAQVPSKTALPLAASPLPADSITWNRRPSQRTT
jgi:hypothetical protein